MITKQILIIAPHGLDEVLGCAGTIRSFINKGWRVQTAILFGGRAEYAQQAARVLGTAVPVFAHIDENTSDTLRLGDLVVCIEGFIKQVEPSIVFIPSAGTLHIDHRKTHEAAITAMRPVPGFCVQSIFGYEILSSTEWVPAHGWSHFSPQLFIDISQYVDIKEKALQAYSIDMKDEPHARSISAVLNRQKMWGATVGSEYCEAFEVIRMLTFLPNF